MEDGKKIVLDISCFKMILLKVFLSALVLEVFVFNFRHWESLSFTPITHYQGTIGAGLEVDSYGNAVITNVDEAYIEFSNINRCVKNLFLDLTKENEDKSGRVTINIRATDVANKNFFLLPEREVINGIENSKFIRLHLSGESSAIRINLLADNGTYFKINNLNMNVHVPFDFVLVRFLIIFICILFYYCYIKSSIFFSKTLNLFSKKQCFCIAFCIVIQMMIVFFIGQSMQPSLNLDRNGWPADFQYNDLADALIDGNVYLDKEPPESLMLMENPYDMVERNKVVVEEHQEKFDWDYAYFDGKYYSYFGVVPAILFFVPYKLITGMDLWTWDLVTACGVAYCIASFFMIYQFLKKYFKESSLGMYLLLSSFYIWGSAVTYLVHYGNVYSCPIIFSLLLGTLGLGCYAGASDGVKINKPRLTIGAILIALIMGCRPHLAVVMIFAFPIFWNEIFRKRLFFSKKGIINTSCVIIPFIFVATFLMWYNYTRFGSVFDFGANYNLTGNDMTHRGFSFERWPLGVFEYLFQPIRVKPQFPFWQIAELSNDYMGHTSYEFIICGFFSMNIITIICCWVFKLKRCLKKCNVYGISVICVISALCIILADIQLSGITQRYMSDFGWIISLGTILILFSLETILRDRKEISCYYKVCSFLVGISIFLNVYNLFIVGRYGDLINMNPFLYYSVKYRMPLF